MAAPRCPQPCCADHSHFCGHAMPKDHQKLSTTCRLRKRRIDANPFLRLKAVIMKSGPKKPCGMCAQVVEGGLEFGCPWRNSGDVELISSYFIIFHLNVTSLGKMLESYRSPESCFGQPDRATAKMVPLLSRLPFFGHGVLPALSSRAGHEADSCKNQAHRAEIAG